VYTYQKVVKKLNLTFLISPFCFDIENIETKMCFRGFQEQMFSIQEQRIIMFLSVLIQNIETQEKILYI